jgi:hypothetical protein
VTAEAEYLTEVYKLCDQYTVLYHHCPGLHCTGKGLPDLILAGPRGVIFREVKTTWPEKPTPEQTTWLYTLRAAGISAKVWTESDLLAGNVEYEIRKIS